MKIVIVFFLSYFFTFLTFGNNAEDSCQKYDQKLAEARTFFEIYEEIELKLTLKSSFIKNYNNFSKEAKDLNVDRLTLFMLLDKTEWYVLGAKEGCFTFWINLEPDRFIELIDGKSLADDQGLWRVE